MYYIVSEQGGKLLDVFRTPRTQRQMQELAEYFECDVYAIEGQHSGMSAVYVEQAGKATVCPNGHTSARYFAEAEVVRCPECGLHDVSDDSDS